ncbi:MULTISPECIES: MFS transporter [Amycolatopsis]|uniref:Putative proline/betaine transporter n=1 Tax=Amycolatopsis dendrobii TaxID=2760662 RepID=A0A7W3Z8A3_9PSEU|nr:MULTISPECIES: MFS transporter [Amycolatopsis]MBB1151587.1 MHS family MFS transporter [Amycolatopsis dendrobii]UKD58202.1 MHS family MFS transporter [Amycolatopsis sp. FU40]
MVLEQETKTAGRIRRVALASAIGTTIEWYDYFAYSTATALVFNKLFFPSLSPASGTLAAFATLGVGFVARPLGGIVWGHFGDRVGRKAMLVASLVLMGLATAGVGVLPTYHQAGVIAPVLLVVLRVLQGISAGGEWGGAALMAVEHAPEGKRGRYGSFSQIGVPAGLILAQLVFFLVNSSLSADDFRSWGWRIPFLVSLVLVAVGLVIRLRVEESPVFAKLRSTGERSKLPIVEVLRARPKQVLAAAVSFIANTALGYIFFAYLLSYGTSVLKLSSTTMLVVVIVGSVVWLASIVAAAIWSDSAGRKPVYLAGSVLLVVWSIPFFLLVDTARPWLLIVAVVVLNVGLGATYGPQSALFSELFESRFRYSGSSFAYAVGAVLGGGFAPLIAASLQSSTGTSLSVSLYMVGVGVLSLLAVLAFPRKPLVPVTAE